MFDKLPGEFSQSLGPPLWQSLWGMASTFLMAGLGRLMWHVQEVRKARRRFFSLHLVWELVTAISMAFVADGLATYLGMTGKPALAIIVTVSYLGPRGLEVAILAGLTRYRGRP